MEAVDQNKLTIGISNLSYNSIANGTQIFRFAKRGVGTAYFYDLANKIKMDNKSLAHLLNLSSRTINNYHANKKNLEPVQGEHLLKLIALYNKGIELFGNIEEFNSWLSRPFWNANEKPIDWLITSGGVDLVNQELDRTGYGYPV